MTWDNRRSEIERTILGLSVGLFATIVGAVLFGGLMFGLYEAFWSVSSHNAAHSYAIQSQNANRQAGVIQADIGTQEGYQAKISADLTEIVQDGASMAGAPDPADFQAEINAAGDDACQQATLLQPASLAVPSQMAGWIKANCEYGQLSMSSPIRTGKVS